jgi:hypothetical protein
VVEAHVNSPVNRRYKGWPRAGVLTRRQKIKRTQQQFTARKEQQQTQLPRPRAGAWCRLNCRLSAFFSTEFSTAVPNFLLNDLLSRWGQGLRWWEMANAYVHPTSAARRRTRRFSQTHEVNAHPSWGPRQPRSSSGLLGCSCRAGDEGGSGQAVFTVRIKKIQCTLGKCTPMCSGCAQKDARGHTLG